MRIDEAGKVEVCSFAARCMLDDDDGVCLSKISDRDCGWMDASDHHQMVKKVVTPSVV